MTPNEMGGKNENELLPLNVYPLTLTLLHLEWPNLYGVLAILSAKGLSTRSEYEMVVEMEPAIQFHKILTICFY